MKEIEFYVKKLRSLRTYRDKHKYKISLIQRKLDRCLSSIKYYIKKRDELNETKK